MHEILLFAFLKSFRPGEPFLVPYLIYDKEFTKEQVNNQIFPVWDYAHWVLLPLMCWFAEMPFSTSGGSRLGSALFRYKIVISMEAIGDLVTRLLLIYGRDLVDMQLMQIAFAIGTSADLMLHTFVFKAFSMNQHRKMTAYFRIAVLLGRSFGALLGQLLLSYCGWSYRSLFILSAFGTVGACFSWLWFFFFSTKNYDDDEMAVLIEDTGLNTDIDSYSDEKEALLISVDAAMNDESIQERKAAKFDLMFLLVIYSLNWAALFSVYEYGASLWHARGQRDVLNGYVDFGACTVGSIGALASWIVVDKFPGFCHLTSNDKRRLLLLMGLVGVCVLMYLESILRDFVHLYIVYVGMVGCFHLVSSTCSAWIGSASSELKYKHAVVFGMAAFCSAGIKALMQLVMTSISVDVFTRFNVYTFFTLSTLLFGTIYCISGILRR